jgi:hypothetical protein
MRAQAHPMRIHRRLHPIDIPLDTLVVHEHTGGPEVRNFHFREFNSS